ncbi:MAG: DnaD domain protein [Clostridiales bacterium]|nr:DnaD domain protein [Clostridiales bacterium]
MNYIREINNFRLYTRDNPLQATTQALWYFLMHINNTCGWIEWFSASNKRLMDELIVSDKTLARHREILCENGLILYESQKNKKKSGRYKLMEIDKLLAPYHSQNDTKINGVIPLESTCNGEINGNIPLENACNGEINGNIPLENACNGEINGNIPLENACNGGINGNIPLEKTCNGGINGNIPLEKTCNGEINGNIPLESACNGEINGNIPLEKFCNGITPNITKRSSSSYINTTTTKDNITFKKVVEFFNQNFHTITPHETELIKSWLDEFTEEVVLKALVVSVEAGKRSIQYFEGVLKNWLKNDLKTVEAIETHQRNFSVKRIPPAKGQTTQNKFHNFDQREKYSNDELERKLGIKS